MFSKLLKKWKNIKDDYEEEMLLDHEVSLEQIEQECQQMEDSLSDELLKDMRRHKK
ncbi:MAG: hypothetical protein ACRCWI_00015 [Brevinema sp.]